MGILLETKFPPVYIESLSRHSSSSAPQGSSPEEINMWQFRKSETETLVTGVSSRNAENAGSSFSSSDSIPALHNQSEKNNADDNGSSALTEKSEAGRPMNTCE
ncbi:unnamed protein product [Clavelina lepadiformis]|uniref:Uncharacterized protein n=1 Tax=Clavelina lepadiformis TaxID=159417 RepID=A0ABP0GJZ8_CLALP